MQFLDKDYSTNILHAENRCFGTQCFASSQCGVNDTSKEQYQCFNTTCQAAVACNSSYVFEAFENDSEQKRVVISSLNRCTDIPCSSDSQCSSGKCSNSSCILASDAKPTCNSTDIYRVFNDQDRTTTFIASNNRCELTVCAKALDCSTCNC